MLWLDIFGFADLCAFLSIGPALYRVCVSVSNVLQRYNEK